MEKIFEFLANNWVYVAIVSMIVVKVLNKITKHFSEYKGLVKVCLFVIDLLDVIKVTPPPKFVKDPATGRTILNSLLCFALVLSFVGCAGWQEQIKEGGKDLQQCLQTCAIKCGVEAAKEAVCPVIPMIK